MRVRFVSDELAIVIPVLNRPHNVAPLLDSISAATPGARILFVCDASDLAEIAEIDAAGAEHIDPGGGYAAKINLGVEATDEPFVFFGADDLEFVPGWLDAARRQMDRAGAAVIGVNDLIRRNRLHSTHFLVTREYAQRSAIDGSRGPLFEGYDHSFVDDEFVATAKARGTYAYAAEAKVRHNHPMNQTAPDDDTYRRGREHFRMDRKRFQRRTKHWI